MIKYLLAGFLCIIFLISGCGGGGSGNDILDASSDEVDNDPLQDDVDSESSPSSPGKFVSVSPLYEARALLIDGQPLPGIPDSKLKAIKYAAMNKLGKLIVVADYEESNLTYSSLWLGDVNNLTQISRTGSSAQGLSDVVRIGTVASNKFSISNNGSAGGVVSLSGASDDDAFAISRNGDLNVLAIVGDSLSGFNEAIEITKFENSYISDEAAALTVSVKTVEDGLNHYLLFWNGSNFVPIARDIDSDKLNGQIDPTYPGTECLMGIGTGIGNDIDDAHFTLTESNHVVFTATLERTLSDDDEVCYSSGRPRKAIARFGPDGIAAIVKEGDPVPGLPGVNFSKIKLLSVGNNGTVIISADLDRKETWWTFSMNGKSSLIAITGEEVELGNGVSFLPRLDIDGSIDYNGSNNHLAVRIQFDEGVSLFGGEPRVGQPHSDISAIGAASLKRIISANSPLPSPFDPADFFSRIGPPHFGLNEILVFNATLANADSAQTASTKLWTVNQEGIVSELIGVTALFGPDDYLVVLVNPLPEDEIHSSTLLSDVIFVGRTRENGDALVHARQVQ